MLWLGGGAPFFKESKKFGPAIEGEDKFIISACYPFSHSFYLTVSEAASICERMLEDQDSIISSVNMIKKGSMVYSPPTCNVWSEGQEEQSLDVYPLPAFSLSRATLSFISCSPLLSSASRYIFANIFVFHLRALKHLFDIRQTFGHNWFSLLLAGLICSMVVTRLARNTVFDNMLIMTFASQSFVLSLMTALALLIPSTTNTWCLVNNFEILICQVVVSFTLILCSKFFSPLLRC